MRSLKTIVIISLMIALLGGCSPIPPRETILLESLPTPEQLSPTSTPEPVERLVRIRLTTTSDWTTLNLMAGTTWQEQELISASPEASNVDFSTSQLILEQPLSRAESGQSVEMITETLFAPWGSGRPIVLQIERGDLGSTVLEISLNLEGDWGVVKKARWAGSIGELNQFRVEIPADQIFGDVLGPGAASLLEAEPVDPVLGLPAGTDGLAWWNDSIFYEIFVRSFYDSNGDGIGDFKGVIEKLDYLNDGDPETTDDLGVTGIWLMPIFASPTYHGYNVVDYKTVNPQYGTMDDLKNLLDTAHARGIRVILDIALGQTSNEHPWFLSAQNPASPFHDWYIWSDYDPGYSGSWGQQVWHPLNGRYYYGTFSAYSPDLNLNNPEVTANLQEVIRFWLEDVGVDGFRLDSAKHMIEEGKIQANSASTHAWWKEFRPFYKEINPQALTVSEIWEDTQVTAEYLQGDEHDLSFEFWLAGAMISAVNLGSSERVNRQIELSYSLIPNLQFATFLTNHDQERLMDQLDYSPEKNKAAASLLLTAPGVPFLYYGEEVGLYGQKPDESIRAPMQWSSSPQAGFTTGTPWQELGPDWEYSNVANQTDDPSSLLAHYRDLILARNQHAALRVGDLNVVGTGSDALYSILRVSENEAVLVLVNLTWKTITDYRLSLIKSSLPGGTWSPAVILGEGYFAPLTIDSGGGFSDYVPIPDIPPYGTYILQLIRVPDA